MQQKMNARATAPRPEALLWDSRRRSWILVVSLAAFTEPTLTRRSDRRPAPAAVTVADEAPPGSWAAAVVVLGLLAGICAVLFLL